MFRLYIIFAVALKLIVGDVQVNEIPSLTGIQLYSPIYYNGKLYIIDFMNGTIICYDDVADSYQTAKLPMANPTYLIKLKNRQNQFLTSDHLTASVIEWDSLSPTVTKIRDAFAVETGEQNAVNNWNTAKASPKGTFLGGTFRGSICSNSSAPYARLYTYDQCNGIQTIDIPQLKSSCGITWNEKGNKVYQIAACQRIIREYDYDLNTGKYSNGHIVFSYEESYGPFDTFFPIGLTMDTDNFLYISMYDMKYDIVAQKVVQVIKVPDDVVTAVEFGGTNYDKLFICTASKVFDVSTGEISNRTYSSGGKLYVATGLGAKGFPQYEICI